MNAALIADYDVAIRNCKNAILDRFLEITLTLRGIHIAHAVRVDPIRVKRQRREQRARGRTK